MANFNTISGKAILGTGKRRTKMPGSGRRKPKSSGRRSPMSKKKKSGRRK